MSNSTDTNRGAAAPLATLMARLGAIQLGRHQIWIILAVVCSYLFATEPNFRTAFNVSNLLLDCSFVGLLAVGLTPIIITRNIDLSIGSILGLSACLTATLSGSLGATAALVALAAGAACGLFNGLLVRFLKLDSFIVTLAAMIGLRGVAFLVAGQGSISVESDALTSAATYYLGPLSILPVVAILFALATQIVLTNTVHGRNSFAIGGSLTAATNAGIPVTRHVLANFMFAGFMAALAGVFMASNLGAANANYGRSYELWAIAAVVLGGTRLTGGAGNPINSFAAALLLSVLRNGMNLKQVSSFYVLIVMGAALILALLVDRYMTNNQSVRSGGNAPRQRRLPKSW